MKDRRPEAYITGIGAVTPLGVGRKKLWSSLLANESGAGPITLFDPEDFEVRIAAECTDFDPESFMDRKVAARTDRFGQMGLASAKLALEDADAWDILNQNPERVGLILGTGLGGVTSMEGTQATIDSKGPTRVNPFAVTRIMPNSAAAHVGIQLGVQGPSIAGALACTCGTDMMGLGFDLIRRGDADVVICGASEATITPVIMAGFIAMRAMSRRNDDPEGACRPYDADHSGFLTGEGPESQAMAEINPRVMVSATKSTLGHSLGATGAIETAICALAVKEKTVPPMRNLAKLAEDCAELDYVVDEPREAPDLKAALCANLGVGGHNAALVLERA